MKTVVNPLPEDELRKSLKEEYTTKGNAVELWWSRRQVREDSAHVAGDRGLERTEGPLLRPLKALCGATRSHHHALPRGLLQPAAGSRHYQVGSQKIHLTPLLRYSLYCGVLEPSQQYLGVQTSKCRSKSVCLLSAPTLKCIGLTVLRATADPRPGRFPTDAEPQQSPKPQLRSVASDSGGLTGRTSALPGLPHGLLWKRHAPGRWGSSQSPRASS
ncbi:uncharacterized protein LOC102156765 [Canis lupus familiaris]|uniref:uncharacterized protein LOC102156765 n=1 Tax=Canis lupus familiaris TaxID=9615 RepID=UPI0018F7DC8A|nr:uncharacterized protein LOC102156765 [Canis lupus familiaris]